MPTHLNQNIFENLAISQDKSFCEKHQNKCPVIFVSFKDIKQSSYEQAYDAIAILMYNLYAQHMYLFDESYFTSTWEIYFKIILNQKRCTNNLQRPYNNFLYYLSRKFGQTNDTYR